MLQINQEYSTHKHKYLHNKPPKPNKLQSTKPLNQEILKIKLLDLLNKQSTTKEELKMLLMLLKSLREKLNNQQPMPKTSPINQFNQPITQGNLSNQPNQHPKNHCLFWTKLNRIMLVPNNLQV
jgi:hypothetical protein